MALTRDILKFSRLCTLSDLTEISNGGSLKKFPLITSVRTAKHYDPRFKWLRSKKYKEIKLPHTKEFKRERVELITNLGIYPRYWKSRPLTVVSAGEIIDPYKPVVGDGKISKLAGAKSLVTDTKSQMTEMNARRKIRQYEANFSQEIFVQEAQDIYVNAHTALTKNSAEELSQYVTERANEEMRQGLKNCTIKWKLIESIEPPKIVQSRVAEVLTKSNLFVQITVRFHTKQLLAIYDRFGRLMYGSEILAKDVLEYVVFEKHLNNENGIWRLHAKIIPEWVEPQPKPARTYRMYEEEEEEEDELDEHFEGISRPEPTESTEIAPVEAQAEAQVANK